MRRIIIGAVAGATILGGLTLTAQTASAVTDPSCNTTVYSNVDVTHDRWCGSSGWLRIGAPGLTVNLHGHTIHGLGGSFTGLDVQGWPATLIKNGSLEAFRVNGIDASNTVGTTIDTVKVFNVDGNGVDLSNADYAALTNVAVTNANTGIRACNGTHNSITMSNLVGNNIGVLFTKQNRGTVKDMTASYNNVAYMFMQDDSGSTFTNLNDVGSTIGVNVLKSGNSSTTALQTGPVVTQSKMFLSYIGYLDGCQPSVLNAATWKTVKSLLIQIFPLSLGPWYDTFKNDKAISNNTGYKLLVTGATVKTSTVDQLTPYGIGIWGLKDKNSRILNNTITTSGAFLTGIALDGSVSDLVAQNSSTNTGVGSTGVLVRNLATVNQVAENVANNNGYAGFDVPATAGVGNLLTMNHATNNGQYGYHVALAAIVGTLSTLNEGLNNGVSDFLGF